MDLELLQLQVNEIVKRAGTVAKSEQAHLKRKLKPDGSIVTNADHAVEQFLRDELAKQLPGANFWGEECGFAEPGPDGLWVVDPIDGTTNYACGIPLWGVSVGLYFKEKVRIGVIYLPDFKELYSSSFGSPATLNGKALLPIAPGDISRVELVTVSDSVMSSFSTQQWPFRLRNFGCFIVSAMYLASGKVRGLIDHRFRFYDIAASVCICRALDINITYADGSQFLESEAIHPDRSEKPLLMFPKGSRFVLG